MSKWISSRELSPTLALQTCSDGFWLYDKTRGMNLAMGVKTEEEAFVKALGYYQQRLRDVEDELRDLRNQVEAFVTKLPEDLLPYREE